MMLGERLGERLPALDRVQDLRDDATQLRVVRELGERREAPVERQPGVDEGRELLRHDEEIASLDAPAPDRRQ